MSRILEVGKNYLSLFQKNNLFCFLKQTKQILKMVRINWFFEENENYTCKQLFDTHANLDHYLSSITS